jgi:two-component system, chemotaxis family, protein-glutamate methylesterase/glutaminase
MSIKVMIVDDSGFMRIVLRKMLMNDPDIDIVGEARNGEDAVQMAVDLKPDVITMDVEMPKMDGIEATKRILAQHPCAVIMLSSVTQEGSDTTFRALDQGAVDFISKSSSMVQLDIATIEAELKKKIRYWNLHVKMMNKSSTSLTSRMKVSAKYGEVVRPFKKVKKVPDIVLIGVSTGGPKLIMDLLAPMGKLACPVVIAQHMGADFTAGFASYLQGKLSSDVCEGKNRQLLENGQIVVAPGGMNLALKRDRLSRQFRIRVSHEPDVHVRPSVDVLFESASLCADYAVGLVLTGMGIDGSVGGKAMANKDWPILAQSPDTCIVDGMPKASIKAGIVSKVLSLQDMGEWLNNAVGE